MITWLTGQPGSGKTTLSEYMMLNMGSDVFHIDGDDLRNLYGNTDFSEEGRRKNVLLAQNISEYLHNKGKHVFVSLVSPYKDQREMFKQRIGENFIEIYVHTSEIRGKEQYFVSDYQPPTSNFLDLDTTNKSIEECSKLILEYANSSRRG
jgi:adenylylsulfate kinase-like enzyme